MRLVAHWCQFLALWPEARIRSRSGLRHALRSWNSFVKVTLAVGISLTMESTNNSSFAQVRGHSLSESDLDIVEFPLVRESGGRDIIPPFVPGRSSSFGSSQSQSANHHPSGDVGRLRVDPRSTLPRSANHPPAGVVAPLRGLGRGFQVGGRVNTRSKPASAKRSVNPPSGAPTIGTNSKKSS